jgi:hypothetical protein
MIANLDPLVTVEFDLELQYSYADTRAILIKCIKQLAALGDPYMKGARVVAGLNIDTPVPSPRTAAPPARRTRDDAAAAQPTMTTKKPRAGYPCRFGIQCHKRRCRDDHPAGWAPPIEVASATTAPAAAPTATALAEPRPCTRRAGQVLGDVFAPASRCVVHTDLAVPHTNADCKAAGHPKNHYVPKK